MQSQGAVVRCAAERRLLRLWALYLIHLMTERSSAPSFFDWLRCGVFAGALLCAACGPAQDLEFGIPNAPRPWRLEETRAVTSQTPLVRCVGVHAEECRNLFACWFAGFGSSGQGPLLGPSIGQTSVQQSGRRQGRRLLTGEDHLDEIGRKKSQRQEAASSSTAEVCRFFRAVTASAASPISLRVRTPSSLRCPAHVGGYRSRFRNPARRNRWCLRDISRRADFHRTRRASVASR